MPVRSKDFHVVAYLKPEKRGEERKIIAHGEIGADGYLNVQAGDSHDRLDAYVENQDGRLELSIGYDHVALQTGKKTVETNAGTLIIEARRVVDEKGKVIDARKVTPLALRLLEAQLQKEEDLAALRDRVRDEIEDLSAQRADFIDSVDVPKPSDALRRALPAVATAYDDAVARWRAKVDGPLTAREQEAGALLASTRLTPAQVDRFCDKRARLSDALETQREVIYELVENLQQIERHVPHARSHSAARDRFLTDLVPGLVALLDDVTLTRSMRDQVEAATTKLAALSSPGFDVVGEVSVTPTLAKNGTVTHWAVRFENQGPQPFAGTVVFADGNKNGGIGLESMAMPKKGCAAEQHLIVGGDYGGVQALPGERIRVGVRSFGWIEVALPKRDAVTASVGDFHVENDGQNRPEDWKSAHLEDKRLEKFATGKVRFFENGKPWWPR